MSDQIQAVREARVIAGDDLWDVLDQAQRRMRRVLEMEPGLVVAGQFTGYATDQSNFMRRTVDDVRRAMADTDRDPRNVSVFLHVWPDASQEGELVVTVQIVAWFSSPHSTAPVLRIGISGSSRVTVDGLAEAAVGVLQKVTRPARSVDVPATAGVPANVASQPRSFRPLASNAQHGQAAGETHGTWWGRTWRDHAAALVTGLVVAVVGGAIVAWLGIAT
ncbi:MAG: hypothetical protein ACRDVO_16060 [Jiangellaceae bacterium]